MKFQKKPVIVDAVKFCGDERVVELPFNNGGSTEMFVVVSDSRGRFIPIKTLEGTMVASPGDWIIRGVKGEFYPCKPDIFEATYEHIG